MVLGLLGIDPLLRFPCAADSMELIEEFEKATCSWSVHESCVVFVYSIVDIWCFFFSK